MLFPEHDFKIVKIIVLLSLMLISYVGANFAMKIQYGIMVLIALSLVSFFSAQGAFTQPVLSQGVPDSPSFWIVFAVFFPAVTGIGSGVAMSGELKNPKKSLPTGILAAVATGFIIYISISIFFAGLSKPEELVSSTFLMVEKSRFSVLIYAGIMGATLSSALGSIIGAPRILQALSTDRVIVLSNIFSKIDKNGNPIPALLLTGVIVLVSFFLGDLDTIATLLTMFFLVTYGVINATVLIEKAIRIPSFRPSFKIPLYIPLIGVLWCTVVMFLINSIFAAAAYGIIILLYFSYVKRDISAPFGDVRSGIFYAIAEWALRISMRLPHHEKSWKPNLIVPIKDPETWSRKIEFIEAIVGPGGTLRIFTINEVGLNIDKSIGNLITHFFQPDKDDIPGYSTHSKGFNEKNSEIVQMASQLNKEGIIATAGAVDAINFLEGLSIVLQTSKNFFFPPNLIFLSIGSDQEKDKRNMEVLALSIREKLGVILLKSHPKYRFGKKNYVNIWLRIGSPNKNLAVLTAIQLEKSWNCKLRLITTVFNAEQKEVAQSELYEVYEQGRLNARTEIHVIEAKFKESLLKAPDADLNIFGISSTVKMNEMREISDKVGSSCLFITDSGNERIDV
jgi:solute carrier family 12 sodium/potassium/chloride transporter 2